MKHAKMLWNFNIRQRFCTTCGRTSDHVVELDARIEMDQFDCQLPYVEVPVARPGEETVQVAFRYTNGQLGQYAWGGGRNFIRHLSCTGSPRIATYPGQSSSTTLKFARWK
jgi:hypothetical protein